jgi:hypothetical protein
VFRFLARAFFSVFQSAQIGSGFHSGSYRMDMESERSAREADHSRPASIETRNN